MKRTSGLIVCLTVLILGTHSPGFAQESSASGQSTRIGAPPEGEPRIAAARVRDEVITFEELEQAVSVGLAQIEQQRHALLSQRLEELIEERLLTQEAKKRGVTVEELLKTEVYAHAPRVTETEVAAFLAKNRAHFSSSDEVELRLRIWDYLRSARLSERRQAYVRTLRAGSEIAVYLKEPAAARVNISSERGHARGSTKAAVAIVEFSDFQCQFCRAVLPVIRQIVDKYESKVKWVFRDFPIAAIHPAALKAHEAARCAGAQGKFWEYHDVLFERSPAHSLPELKQYAQELGLDKSAFAACLDQGAYRTEVNNDIQEGIRLGLSGTPTFFVNGRVLVGAQPLEAFERLIQLELAEQGTK